MVAGRFITGRFNTVGSSRGRFITRSIQHRRFITQKLLYSAIAFNESFSKVYNGVYPQENIYVIVIKKMSKLKFKIKTRIKSKSAQNAENWNHPTQKLIIHEKQQNYTWRSYQKLFLSFRTTTGELYRVGQKKVNPKCSTHNFVKYWPILKILSLLQSPENLQCSGH